MNRTSIGILAFAAIGSSALAADLPARVAPPVYIPPATFTWTGFYAGLNAGVLLDGYTEYGLAGNTPGTVNAIFLGNRAAFIATHSTGFAGGGQIGYNFQLPGLPKFGGLDSGFVLGAEADIDGATNTGTALYNGAVTGAASNYRSQIDFIGTVRGRIGYAFGTVLVYGTGGFAYGGVRDSVTTFNVAGANDFFGSLNKIQTGYAYGGGLEYAIPTDSFLNVFHSSAVTIRAEFIHYELGNNNLLVGSTLGTANSYTAVIHNEGNLVRAGVNYKFGAPAAVPVVARY